MSSEPVKLSLGSGDKTYPGYITVDLVDERLGIRPDVQANVFERLPFDDGYADEVMAIHLIEHAYRWQVPDILKDWTRVLKPGGTMILECPDLNKALWHYLTNPQLDNLSMWALYGDPSWRDPLMCHRWAWTPRTLGAEMLAAGLINVRQEPAQFKKRDLRDMRVVGEKPR